MSADLETRLTEAFDARAATTTTSPDAWARVGRRAERRDHRRSVVLKVAAAAVIVVLAVGGAVALFGRDTGRNASTTAKGGAASKSAAEDSAASGVVGPEAATTAPNGTTVAAFPGIGSASATTVGTETVLRFVTDDGASAEVRGTPGSFAWANVSGAGSQVVIGIVPTDASDARVTFADGSSVGTRTVPDPAGAGSRLLVVSSSDASGPVRVDAIAADGSTVATSGSQQ